MKYNFVNRNAEIYAMRKNGTTLREVGLRFGITEQRVAQICKEIEEQNNHAYKNDIDKLIKDINPSDTGMNVRTYNLLKRNGVNSIQKLMSLSDSQILEMRNAGAKTLELIKSMQERVKNEF